MNTKLSGPPQKLVKKSSGRAPWRASSANYNKTVREALGRGAPVSVSGQPSKAGVGISSSRTRKQRLRS